jgi:hypothetical protein
MGGRGLAKALTGPPAALALVPLVPQRRPVPPQDADSQGQQVERTEYFNPVFGGVFPDPDGVPGRP